jgi:hypothetical protein
MTALRLYLLNYVSSASSGYATHTRRDAYRGEEEAAGLSPVQSVTVMEQC